MRPVADVCAHEHGRQFCARTAMTASAEVPVDLAGASQGLLEPGSMAQASMSPPRRSWVVGSCRGTSPPFGRSPSLKPPYIPALGAPSVRRSRLLLSVSFSSATKVEARHGPTDEGRPRETMLRFVNNAKVTPCKERGSDAPKPDYRCVGWRCLSIVQTRVRSGGIGRVGWRATTARKRTLKRARDGPFGPCES